MLLFTINCKAQSKFKNYCFEGIECKDSIAAMFKLQYLGISPKHFFNERNFLYKDPGGDTVTIRYSTRMNFSYKKGGKHKEVDYLSAIIAPFPIIYRIFHEYYGCNKPISKIQSSGYEYFYAFNGERKVSVDIRKNRMDNNWTLK